MTNRLSNLFNWNARNLEEAFGYPNGVFKLFGINIDDRRGYGAWAAILTRLVLLFPFTYFVFGINSIEMYGGSDRFFEFMCGTSVALNTVTKLINCYGNSDNIFDLIHAASEQFNKYMNNKLHPEKSLASKYLKIMNLSGKYITLSYYSAVLSFFLTPLAYYVLNIPNSEWMLPVTIRVFFTNPKSHPGYELNFVYSTFLITFFGSVLAACDLFLLYLCFFVFIQLDVCEMYCQQIGKTTVGISEIEHLMHLRKCILLHREISVFLKDVSRIFVWPILMQCLVAVLTLASAISYWEYSVFRALSLSVGVLVEQIAFCAVGQIIINKSQNVCAGIYMSDWYHHLKDRKMTKTLQIFLCHAHMQNELVAFGIVNMSTTTLTQFLKATYTYVAFLKKTVK